ncbi:hypothetical protein TorRG33x02_059870 [Trema orientale]|uniref:Transmembrane protein n=1 Tax=Trema orientale TaxID=63057 RepID=A0A2P5FK52_TREOI|nr:hypothetical protein TorRG33x02_059870 [Trema orientale]
MQAQNKLSLAHSLFLSRVPLLVYFILTYCRSPPTDPLTLSLTLCQSLCRSPPSYSPEISPSTSRAQKSRPQPDLLVSPATSRNASVS